jgi:hypothetical protein
LVPKIRDCLAIVMVNGVPIPGESVQLNKATYKKRTKNHWISSDDKRNGKDRKGCYRSCDVVHGLIEASGVTNKNLIRSTNNRQERNIGRVD